MQDPLTPLYVRLRASTIEGLRDAQNMSEHRTLAAYVDAILRQHLAGLAMFARVDGVDRLRQSADKIQREP